jgi:hypothetical protein
MYCTYLYIYIYITQLYYMTLFHYIILLLVGGFKCYCTTQPYERDGWLRWRAYSWDGLKPATSIEGKKHILVYIGRLYSIDFCDVLGFYTISYLPSGNQNMRCWKIPYLWFSQLETSLYGGFPGLQIFDYRRVGNYYYCICILEIIPNIQRWINK